MAEEKERRRVLLACVDQEFLLHVQKLLEEDGRFEVVGCAVDGEQAWRLFQKHNPALTVADTELPYLDGLVLSRRIRTEKGRAASILLISAFSGSQIYRECTLLQIDALTIKPIRSGALYERICLLDQCLQHDPFELRIAQILRELGMSEETKGYRYTIRVICLYRKAEQAGITKEIYPQVAKEMGTDREKIERDMRYAISRVWRHCDRALLERYFGRERVRKCKSIGNRAFCAALLQYLRQEENLW